MDKNFRELLKKEYVVFDGAMGTMLQAAGMKMGETPEVLSITQPQLLVGIHESICVQVQMSSMPTHSVQTVISWKNAEKVLMRL